MNFSPLFSALDIMIFNIKLNGICDYEGTLIAALKTVHIESGCEE